MANIHRLRSGRQYITAPESSSAPLTPRRSRPISLDRIQRSFTKLVKKKVPREVSIERTTKLLNKTISQLVSSGSSGFLTPPTELPIMGDLGDQNLRLKTFNGTTDVKEFIKRFNIVTAARGVTDDGKKATWIPVFLTEPAMAYMTLYRRLLRK